MTSVKYIVSTLSPQLVHNMKFFDATAQGAYADVYSALFYAMTTMKELWENALVELELTISKPNFNTWFKDTHITRIEDGAVYLGVPSQIARDWLSAEIHTDI